MNFKTKMRGYDKYEVDKYIAEQLDQLNNARKELALMKERLSESLAENTRIKENTKLAVAESQRVQSVLEYRLNDMTQKYKEASEQLNLNRQRTEGIGQIYYYAYNNAVEITKKAYERSSKLILETQHSIEKAFEKAGRLIGGFNEEQRGLKNQFNDVYQGIQQIGIKLNSLAEKTSEIKVPDGLNGAAITEMEKDYQMMMADFRRNAKSLLEKVQYEPLGHERTDFNAQSNPMTDTPSETVHIKPEDSTQEDSDVRGNIDKDGSTQTNSVVRENFIPILEEKKQQLNVKPQPEPVAEEINDYKPDQVGKRRNVRELLKKYSQLN